MGLEDRDWFQEGRRERIQRAEGRRVKAAAPIRPPPPPPPRGGNTQSPDRPSPSSGSGLPSHRGPSEGLQIGMLVGVASFLAIGYWFAHDSGPVPWLRNVTGMTPPPLTRVFPPSGEVKWFVYQSGAPLAIVRVFAGSQDTRTVALFETWRSHTPVVETFLDRDGQSSMMVPVGRYRLVIARGNTWYGDPTYFGANGSFHAAIAPIVLSASDGLIVGKTIDLQRRFDGNLPTRPIAHP